MWCSSARATPPGGTPADSPGGLSLTIDTAPPTLAPPQLGTLIAPDAGGLAVNFAVTAGDVLDNAPVITYPIAPGSVFQIGQTTVNATATDRAGNATTIQFIVDVRLSLPDPVIGGLDGSFGNGMGVVTVTVPNNRLTTLDSFIFGDGSVRTAGFDVGANQLVLTQLAGDGSVNIAFGTGGRLRVAGPVGFAVRRGQFGVSGNSYLLGETEDGVPGVVRYTMDGNRDGGFGAEGVLTVAAVAAGDRIDSIAEGVGRIRGLLLGGAATIGGVRQAVVVSVLPDFSANSRFGVRGVYARPSGDLSTFNAITVTAKSLIFPGGIATSGSADDNPLQASAIVVQLASTGRPARFGPGVTGAPLSVPGFEITSGPEVIAQSDGKILLSMIVAGMADDVAAGRVGGAIARFTSQGELDWTFNGTGLSVVAEASAGALGQLSANRSGDGDGDPSAGGEGTGLQTLSQRPIERSFDSAQSSLVIVEGGRVREIAAVAVGSNTNIVQSQLIADAVDLVAGGLTVAARRPVKPGSRMSRTLRINHAGTLQAFATVPVLLYLSEDHAFDDADQPLTAVDARLRLRPGAGSNVRLAFVAPQFGGEFFVSAVINESGVLAELRLDNGLAVSTTPFVVNAPAAASMTVSPMQPMRSVFSQLKLNPDDAG